MKMNAERKKNVFLKSVLNKGRNMVKVFMLIWTSWRCKGERV